MKKIIIILVVILSIGTSGFCEEIKLEVGQTCVTTVATGNDKTVFSPSLSGLLQYCIMRKDGTLENSAIILKSFRVITPVKSGVVVLVTAIEENKILRSSNGRSFGPFTIYTVHPDGTSYYFKTFGRGLKVFGK